MTRRLHFVLLSFLFLGCFTGCHVLPNNQSAGLPLDETSPEIYTVQMNNAFGPDRIYTGEIEGNLTVQQALEKSGATKKYRRMNVDLYRHVPEKGRTIKLAIDFQPGKKQVKFEQDYAILSGDRIVVSSRANGLENVVDTIF